MATVLTMSGYTIHTAGTATKRSPCSTRKSASPDVILMDAQMPGLSGARLVQRIAGAQQGQHLRHQRQRCLPPRCQEAVDGYPVEAFRSPGAAATEQRSNISREPRRLDRCSGDQCRRRWRSYAGDARAAVREIYAAVVDDLDKRQRPAVDALPRPTRGEIRRIGHAIKGGCGMAGALQAARLGAAAGGQR